MTSRSAELDLGAVKAFADRHDLLLVEDCCDELGATYAGRKFGMFGDLGPLSFHPAHHITTGERGAVLCNSTRFKRTVESICEWGRDCYREPGQDNTCNKRFGWKLGDLSFGYDHKYTYSHLGYNLKITDMQVAVGVAQLDGLDEFIAARRRNWQHLRDMLADYEDIFILPISAADSASSWFGFCLTLRPEAPIDGEAMLRFRKDEQKVGTRLLFGGNLLKQPYMKDHPSRFAGTLENSDLVLDRIFSLGFYPKLGAEHLDYAVESIVGFIKGADRASQAAE